ncbi:MAG TPA: TlpA family protein disulfide reductase [Gammaproteobacteria bacterium]|nr:TlpA family protein disulfide reductase [Gammaproteobacteria bacterium]
MKYPSIKMTLKIILLSAILLTSLNPVYAAKVGSEAPNLYGRTLSGELFRLKSVPGNKLVNFFWIECAPCTKEIPELKALEDKYPKIRVVAVHVNEKDEDKVTVQQFVSKLKAAPDTIVLSSSLVKDVFSFAAFPYTVLIGDDGKIKATFTGYFGKKSMAKLEAAIQKL